MRKNITTLEDMLTKLKCLFGDILYAKYANAVYGTKICKNHVDLDQLRDYIMVLENKIKLLRYNFGKCENNKDLIEPSIIYRTDIERFYEKEEYLTKCDRKFLEKIYKYL
jgi:cell division protein FtsB